MSPIKITVLHTGYIHIFPKRLEDGYNVFKAFGIATPREDWLWLPVSSYLIEHPRGLILYDAGWGRNMSPRGVYDRKAQIDALGSYLLYKINQGVVEKGMTAKEQLAQMGIKPEDIDYLILSHLDCDHAQGTKDLFGVKNVLLAKDEYRFARKFNIINRIRYHSRWIRGMPVTFFDWNSSDGPFHRSYDLFGDNTVQLISLPGHSPGHIGLKVRDMNGKYVIMYGDCGYTSKSWQLAQPSGIAVNRKKQIQSLKWIREESINPYCIESMGNHDPEVHPHVLTL
ncbi:MAG: N-acyl homoserine lactonase family protein [Bacteroidales bacterium]|nr:N-acyl homoserine lactonase family protein [Bacteroidales bacterium]